MKDRIITIKGQELKIRFCMAAQLAFERITGEYFNVAEIGKPEIRPALCLATIIANNPEADIDIGYILNDAPMREISELTMAVMDAVADWCEIPQVVKNRLDEEKEEDDSGEEKGHGEKN